jgi:hypothetical protein
MQLEKHHFTYFERDISPFLINCLFYAIDGGF